ncbi:nucleoside recognition domain-containing protein [Cytobacillus massiliigabonensis]|uniref:nucleoside recognition domain-containing protein n=1 Tax=Cytobacillus massiliigabonensis TaxID=1871011 RepID=UPI000C8365F7|nr:nucleoside recognition domain-containing protein [Cytobacillus massiliigabonensis]
MLVESSKKGIMVGLKTTWTLGKIIFPVTLIVALLQHTPVLPWVIKLITPLMNLIGLSGDTAIPLVLGNFLNLYAAIGAILTLDLTVKEVFIVAVMLSFSHNMLIESSVAVKVGVKLWIGVAVRLGLALISAIVINLVWQGGSEIAKYGMIPAKEEEVTGWLAILLNALEKAGLGIFQLAIIVIPLMIVIQILKDLKWLAVFSKWMAPVTRMLGMKENTSTTLAAGLLFGLAFGAGVMIQAVKEDGVSKKDVTIAFIFLVACHAVVEDTLIFVPLGIPVLPLLLIRLGVAILLTLIVSFIWNRIDMAKRKGAAYEHTN